MIQETPTLCTWCNRPFRARRGGSPQRFCCAGCRRTFWSALCRWGRDAIAAGVLEIVDVKNGVGAACALPERREPPLPLLDIGRGDTALPEPSLRFVAEVERDIVAGLVRLGFIRPDERDELGAILAGSKRLGWAPRISRVT